MARKTTQTVVALNAKLESVNLLAIETDGSVVIDEGMPVSLAAATGLAKLSVDGEVVFVNFVDSARTDVEFLQGDPYDTTAPTASVQSGGLSGIQGQGTDIGLPAASWDGGALPAVGEYVTIASNKFAGVAAFSGVGTTHYSYGRVYRIKEGRAFFLFSSSPDMIVSHA